ncbi:MAG: hypothetical protein MJZ66_01515 [Bacteroidales bacterium]|nr:hypothetical protein [Bacteroidales bacterium]
MENFIVVDSKSDSSVIKALFPNSNMNVMIANGFSNVLAISTTLIDFKQNLLIVTDAGADKEKKSWLMHSILGDCNVVWMDPNMDTVLKKAVPTYNSSLDLDETVKNNSASILSQPQFMDIKRYLNAS